MKELTQELFLPVGKNPDNANRITRPTTTYFKDAWRRLKQNKIAIPDSAGVNPADGYFRPSVFPI